MLSATSFLSKTSKQSKKNVRLFTRLEQKRNEVASMISTQGIIETYNLRKELQRVLRIPIQAVAVAENPELVSITNVVLSTYFTINNVF